MKGETGNETHPRYIIPIILKGQKEKMLSIYPELRLVYEKHQLDLDNAYTSLLRCFRESKTIENQREFAEYVLPRTKFSSLLFKARQKSLDEEGLRSLWLSSEDLILKVLYNK